MHRAPGWHGAFSLHEVAAGCDARPPTMSTRFLSCARGIVCVLGEHHGVRKLLCSKVLRRSQLWRQSVKCALRAGSTGAPQIHGIQARTCLLTPSVVIRKPILYSVYRTVTTPTLFFISLDISNVLVFSHPSGGPKDVSTLRLATIVD